MDTASAVLVRPDDALGELSAAILAEALVAARVFGETQTGREPFGQSRRHDVEVRRHLLLYGVYDVVGTGEVRVQKADDGRVAPGEAAGIVDHFEPERHAGTVQA